MLTPTGITRHPRRGGRPHPRSEVGQGRLASRGRLEPAPGGRGVPGQAPRGGPRRKQRPLPPSPGPHRQLEATSCLESPSEWPRGTRFANLRIHRVILLRLAPGGRLRNQRLPGQRSRREGVQVLAHAPPRLPTTPGGPSRAWEVSGAPGSSPRSPSWPRSSRAQHRHRAALLSPSAQPGALCQQ